MKVIARNNGPIYKDGIRRGLREGKEYEVISYSERVNDRRKDCYGDFYNPSGYKFYIRVVNEFGTAHDYWNDYFLSTEEIRDIKIDNILTN